MPQKIPTGSKNELLNIAKRGADIRNALKLTSTELTPVNFEVEKEKFFKIKNYNPRYEYSSPPHDRFDIEIDELEQRVEKINLPYDLLFHVIEYLNHLRFLYHARHSIGRETFPVYAVLAFNWKIVDPDKLIKTLPKFKFENEQKGKLINAQEIAEQLRKVVKSRYRVEHFEVSVNNFSKNIIFVDGKTIMIGRDIKRFQNNVDRLIVHEVESHALQNYNVLKSDNHLRLLSMLSDSSLYVEGLAVYNEVKTKTMTKKSFQNYYFRLKSIKNSHLSFRKIYQMLLKESLSEKHAFNIAFRVKRGMSDTSKPGCYPKDAAYLLGYKVVLDFLKNDSEKLLYYAKNPHLTKLLIKYNLIDRTESVYPNFVKNE